MRTPSTTALVLVTGIGPFATDAYIAGLPGLRADLGTSATVAQLTLTAFIVGVAVGQLVLGPVSDATGRRRVLLGGAAVFTALSLVCAVAPSGPVLVAVRLVQGVAAGGGVVVGRAVVTDAYRGDAAARVFGTLASITFLGPVVAPVAGGVLLGFGGWRVVFLALAGLGAAMTAAVALGVRETLPVERRQPPGFAEVGRRMADLVADWAFLRHVLVYAVSAAGFFTYIGGSAFVLQTTFGIGPDRYSLVFASNAAAMAVTGLAFRLLITRVGASGLRAVGLTASTLAAAGLLVADGLPATWALLCVVVGGTGLTVPATTVLAQEAGRRSAGAAAAVQGGLGFLVGALVTPLTGFIGYGSTRPMAVAMTCFYGVAFVLMAVAVRSRGMASGGRNGPR
ncbi:Bcr/CflA family efflux MFS transporter [Actinokineospora sp. PR83]|uniref:Bcr/CflA family efflux MFS transporter n=1 Tax=Actinokineospora sp. PR83 TaxID=2884908 RepID=UPI0027E0343E|nr:Bcr/CflA family efflux MFS transporter [Actinokineospora sp. PR83]MCG8917404.1 Bcr/CflA family efflux MFS transporter [Actinokineospora sp. PR83]